MRLEWDGELVVGQRELDFDKSRIICVHKGKLLWQGRHAFPGMAFRVAIANRMWVGGNPIAARHDFQYVECHPTGVLLPEGWLYTESGLYEEWK